MGEIDFAKIEEGEQRLKREQVEILSQYKKTSSDIEECGQSWGYYGDFECYYGPVIECDSCIYGGGFRHPLTGKDLRKEIKS